jgi:hypothetical protein
MERAALASDRYTPQQLADMARRLDECIEVSALCMDLALAGEMHRQALAATAAATAGSAAATPAAPPVDPSTSDRD